MSGISSYDNFSNASETARKVSYSGTSSTVVNEGNTNAFKAEEMGKDQFLTLLVAQLQHQDPLNPAEDSQFVAQLAQFSQLEFTQNSTQAISQLAGSMSEFMELQTLQAQSITNASATPLLGKEVRVMEASFDYAGLSEKEFNVHLEGTKSGVVVIKDKDDNIVAEIGVEVESSKGGDTKAKWNGTKEDGTRYLAGTYKVEVVDASTGSTNVGYAFQDGVVNGVSFNSNGAGLSINGTVYGLGYLIDVKEDEAAKSDPSSSANYSNDVIKKVTDIMAYKDSGDILERIAETLGKHKKDSDGNIIGVDINNEEVGKIAQILNKDISEDDMIKQLAETIGAGEKEREASYSEMMKKIQAILS